MHHAPFLCTCALVVVVCLCTLGTRTDAAVIVAVHGMAGFGPGELLNIGYWGFPGIYGSKQDYLKQLRDCGWFRTACKNSVFYAAVGPVSSNWDRACELYAQIKGTRVDYGVAHSRNNSHLRFGKDFTGKGFYPAWSKSNPIHLIGHSLGGTTIRMLEYLLQKGDASEVAAAQGSDTPVSSLFLGGKSGWIKSMHTISSPHNGTPLHSQLGKGLVEILKDIMFALGKAAGLIPLVGDWIYDFDMEQFKWPRTRNENFWSYFQRIFSADMWSNGYKDLASYDVSVESAYTLNSKTEFTYPGTYYVTHTTARTRSCLTGKDRCTTGMDPLMAITGALIGVASHISNACKTGLKCSGKDSWCQSRGNATVNFCWTDSWEDNDGLVPTRSAAAPEIGTRGYISPTQRDAAGSWKNGKWVREFKTGRWYTHAHKRSHLQVIGFMAGLFEKADDGTFAMIREDVEWMDVQIVSASEVEGVTAASTSSGSGGSDDVVMIVLVTLAVSVGVVVVGVVVRRRQTHAMDAATATEVVVRQSSAASDNPGFQGNPHESKVKAKNAGEDDDDDVSV